MLSLAGDEARDIVEKALRTYRSTFESAQHIYVAYSGGLDSHVLLHAMAKQVAVSRLTAFHINHQLSPRAVQWAAHCQAVCQNLGVTYLGKDVRVSELASRENAAREARYQAFEEELGANDLLLLAHHGDDQAETILYRLLRSSGPRGLAGMPVSRPLGRARLLRPLLWLEQKLLREYAHGNDLQWVEDESNQNREFDRNFLRHEVIPQLKTRWPNYAQRIADAGRLCDQAEEINEDLAQLDLDAMALRQERWGWSVEIKPLLALSLPRQANVLRLFVRLMIGKLKVLRSLTTDSPVSPPGHRVINEVLDSLLSAEEDRNPVVSWSGGQWRRFRQRLYLSVSVSVSEPEPGVDDTELPCDTRFPWSIEETLLLPDSGQVNATVVKGAGLSGAFSDQLSVRFRQGGERCRPVGRGGSASLKKLFQEHGLEPWLRARIPLVYRDEELIAVPGMWVCEGYQARAGEPGYQLQWSYPSA